MLLVYKFYTFYLYYRLFACRYNSKFLKEVRILVIWAILLLLASTSSLIELLLVIILLAKNSILSIKEISTNYKLPSIRISLYILFILYS